MSRNGDLRKYRVRREGDIDLILTLMLILTFIFTLILTFIFTLILTASTVNPSLYIPGDNAANRKTIRQRKDCASSSIQVEGQAPSE